MAINVEYKETFSKAPVGLFQGVCCEVLDLGFSQKTYKDPNTGAESERNVHNYQFVFQLNKVDPETGKRYEIRSKPMNLTLGERAELRKFMLAWRGHDLTEAERKPPGLDIEQLGRNAMISVVHNTVGDKTYANIGSITPLMEGMAEIQPLNYESKQAFVNQQQQQNQAGNGQTAQAAQAAPATVNQIPDEKIPF